MGEALHRGGVGIVRVEHDRGRTARSRQHRGHVDLGAEDESRGDMIFVHKRAPARRARRVMGGHPRATERIAGNAPARRPQKAMPLRSAALHERIRTLPIRMKDAA